mgnify:CR=1 FL=1
MVMLSKLKSGNFTKTKAGQSAIEYLMTYGWMLLVVAIAGGTVFSVVGDQGVETVTGFTGDDIQVEDFGVTENGLDMVLRNADTNEIKVNSVTVSDQEIQAEGGGATIQSGETGVVTVSNVQPSSETKELDVTVNYDIGSLTGLETSGVVVTAAEVSGVGFMVNDTSPEPNQAVSFEDTSSLADLNGAFVERRWDFDGDGTVDETSTTESDTTTNYTYSAGTYNAELEVETSEENYTATRTISVSETTTVTGSVLTTGGTLNTLQTQDSTQQVINITGDGSSDGACIGSLCDRVDGGSGGDTVTTAGGVEMTGTLTATNVTGNVTITTMATSLNTGTDNGALEDGTVLTGDLAVPTLNASNVGMYAE